MWIGDKQALEDIENLSICVKTDEGIRNLKDPYEIHSEMIVIVWNVPNDSNLRFTINKGQMVRYKKCHNL